MAEVAFSHKGMSPTTCHTAGKPSIEVPIIPAWRQLQHSGTFIPLPMGISIDSRIFLAGFGRIMSSLHSSVTIAAKLRFVTASNCMKAGMVVKLKHMPAAAKVCFHDCRTQSSKMSFGTSRTFTRLSQQSMRESMPLVVVQTMVVIQRQRG